MARSRLSASAVQQRASAYFRRIRDAEVFVLMPPAIQGLGQTSSKLRLAPGQAGQATLTRGADQATLVRMRRHLGFIFQAHNLMMFLNARSEGDHNPDNDPRYTGAKGIIQKPSFRKAIRSQRCLVLADAFIEGPFDRKLSEPYLVYLKGKERPLPWQESGIRGLTL